MPKAIDVGQTIRHNPGVDRQQLKEGFSALRKLRKMGIQKSGPQVVLPFSQQPPKLRKDTS